MLTTTWAQQWATVGSDCKLLRNNKFNLSLAFHLYLCLSFWSSTLLILLVCLSPSLSRQTMWHFFKWIEKCQKFKKSQHIHQIRVYIYIVVYLFGVPPLAVGATTCQFVAYTPHGRVGIFSGQPAWPAASSSDGSILKAVHNVELCVCVCVST